MIKLITVVTMVAIVTTACGTSSARTKEPDTRREFVETVRTKAPATSGIVALTDEQLLHTGDGACTALRNNPNTTPALISNSYDERWPGAGSTLVGAALSYLCQEFNARVDD